ncbi:glycosyl transferase GT2 family [Butyrivibrio proteoclasticus B316]|uniref:Glycosyl transferase GT2 family n=1 Tax=Butyrivibrio proteoclasticus (strain ATCC 51982 / DSM 14932 / B316) TaxID=515622 RepID=E0S0H4_BUTPB|nr:glycosyltransferase family 2 protein [Butyrivibrio proteoclasticus]ADL33299.1 glycosyl transferase GT2 family [Butyrivibrio proteoclasticus B316]
MSEMDYKSAYEREKLKSADLAERIAELEDKNQELQFKLDRIKNNPIWKASTPARNAMHWVIRQRDRVRNQGSLRGVVAKIKYKQIEKKAMTHYGTESFPSEETRKAQESAVFEKMPLISILVPLYNTPEKFLRDMIESVIAQTYSNWQLCLADGSDAEHIELVSRIVREYQEKEKSFRNGGRICYMKLEKNEGISGNTNHCLEMAEGEYIGLFDHDDILHPEVLYWYVKAINEENADYIYCDETTFKGDDINKMITMHFKPDYAIDNLRANNYICHFSVFKRTLLDGTELFRTKFDGSQDHDMILRLTDRAEHIVHVPKLLYYWRSHAGSVASDINAKPYAIDAAKGAVADHLRRHGYDHFKITSTRAFETIFKITYEVMGTPKISIVIPNCEHAEDLRRCISSIYEKSVYDNYEIIVVENGSTGSEIKGYYEELKTGSLKDIVKVVDFYENGAHLNADGSKPPFNYSAVVNYGVQHSDGEYIILLNNDTQVITVNWMEELLMYAQRADVGAVGGKLYFPDRKIQHAGVVLKLGAHRTAGHSHYGQAGMNLGYMGRLCYAQDVSAVTGACLMISRAKYDEVGGLDEGFAVSLNDVDFCLKLREKGYLNVFTPFAELFHYESLSRGLDLEGKNAERYEKESEHFRSKWKEVLDKGDPYYNPNFSLDRSDFSLNVEGYSSLRTQ